MYLVYNEQTGDFEEKLYKDPPEVSFEIVNGGKTIFKGDKVHLTWSVKDAEKIFLNGEELLDQIFSQDITCDNIGLCDFVLVASNPCGDTKRVISVSVIDKPSFEISCSKTKLKRGKNETCELRWNIRFANSITLIMPDGKEQVRSKGKKVLSPTQTATLKFEAIALDNSTLFSDKIEIGVFDECKVIFETNKTYSYPTLPIVLSWKVEHAKSVELIGFGKQQAVGTITVEPTQTTTYQLLVKDEFGERTYEKFIQMLPLPFVKSLLVPTPDIQKNISISCHIPRIYAKVEIPIYIEKRYSLTESMSDILEQSKQLQKRFILEDKMIQRPLPQIVSLIEHTGFDIETGIINRFKKLWNINSK